MGKSGAFSASWEVNVGRGRDKSAQPTLRSQASLDHRALREVTLPPLTSELDEGNTRKDLYRFTIDWDMTELGRHCVTSQGGMAGPRWLHARKKMLPRMGDGP